MIIIPFLWVGEGTTIYRNKQYEALFLEELLYFFVLVFVLSMFSSISIILLRWIKAL
tara:strand:+ start:292 stop:462 length:171 start_codon:yes stop_codon:yes gene_type:complete